MIAAAHGQLPCAPHRALDNLVVVHAGTAGMLLLVRSRPDCSSAKGGRGQDDACTTGADPLLQVICCMRASAIAACAQGDCMCMQHYHHAAPSRPAPNPTPSTRGHTWGGCRWPAMFDPQGLALRALHTQAGSNSSSSPPLRGMGRCQLQVARTRKERSPSGSQVQTGIHTSLHSTVLGCSRMCKHVKHRHCTVYVCT